MDFKAPAGSAHSPKSDLLKNLTAYFAAYDLDKIEMHLCPEVVWTLVGDAPIKGKSDFLAALRNMQANPATDLVIKSIITHGKQAAVHGEMGMTDGSRYGFADFYTFKSAGSTQILDLVSYVVLV
ncbi:MAG: hypothetical protein RLZZ241_845 [Bacteroidota bacterium]